ncbi:MAG: peptidoglycan-binding domain-containing protein [Pseudomonadota bacterium]
MIALCRLLALLPAIFSLLWSTGAPADILGKNKRTSSIPAGFRHLLPGIGVFGSRGGLCTGFCVAPDVAVTSHHCLQTRKERWRSAGLKFRFLVEDDGRLRESGIKGRSPSARKVNIAFGVKRSSYLGTTTKRDASRLESDWAMIRLAVPVCRSVLSVREMLGLPSRTLDGKQHAVMISAEYFMRRRRGQRWTYSGKCRFRTPAVNFGNDAVAHDCATISGTSGAPIFLRDDSGKLVVVAVNSGSSRYTDPEDGRRKTLNRAARARIFADSLPHFLHHRKLWDPVSIRKIQARLRQLHFLDGKADGEFGPKTRYAIARYEHSVGLPELGVPSELIHDLLTGETVAPDACSRRLGKRIVPAACRRMGLPE